MISNEIINWSLGGGKDYNLELQPINKFLYFISYYSSLPLFILDLQPITCWSHDHFMSALTRQFYFPERLVCVFSMLVGFFMYGYSTAIFAATLANLDAARVNYQERLFAVKQFLNERKLQKRLQVWVTYIFDNLFHTLSWNHMWRV